MSGTENYWRTVFLGRFADREDIGKEEVYRRYWEKAGLPKADVFECLNLIESEYELPAGLLRPEDSLSKLYQPVATKNPWRWLVYQTRAGDRQSEIKYELGKQMRKHGTLGTWASIETIDDLIRAWCGRKPGQASDSS
jgi:hypothetical protein